MCHNSLRAVGDVERFLIFVAHWYVVLIIFRWSREIFDKPEELIKLGLDVPESIRFQLKLEKRLGIQISDQPNLSIEELTESILSYLKWGVTQ